MRSVRGAVAGPTERDRKPALVRTVAHLHEGNAPQWLAVGGLIGVLAGVAGFAWAMEHVSYDVFGAVLLAPILIVLTALWARRIGRIEQDPALARLVVLALVLKLLAAVVRYAVAFEVYGGNADAGVYHEAGVRVAEGFHEGEFGMPEAPAGSRFIQYLTGIVYFVVGPTKLGGFFVFSAMGFVGLCLLYRAFRVGFPEGDHRRYAKLVLLLPSMLYWPSSIGKESWMILALGTVAYGGARVLARRPGGFALTGVGLWAAATVRPHVAVAAAASLVVAFLLRRAPRRAATTPLTKLVGAGVLILGAAYLAGGAAHFLGVDTLDADQVQTVLDSTAERTSRGGSHFIAPRVASPLDLPRAAFTILVRPLPHEANNVQAMIASFEGLFLVGLAAVSVPRLMRLPREMMRRPYLVLACIFVVAFVYAFSSISNFGIIVRQRVQVMGFVLALLCIPPPPVPAAPDRALERAEV